MINDRYVQISEPVENPVSLSEVKSWLRVRVDNDDTLIESLINTAVLFGEKYTGRLFANRVVQGYFGGLDASNMENTYFIQVRRSPLSALSAVEVYSDGSYQAFTDYKLRIMSSYSRILFPNGISDANPDTDEVFPIRVVFDAGYGTQEDVPADIKTALKAHISFMYENRGDVIAEGRLSMPLETRAIYDGKYVILDTF